MARFAVNLCDLTEIAQPNVLAFQLCFSDMFTDQIVQAEPDVIGGGAVVVAEDVDELRLWCALDLWRQKLGRKPRAYRETKRGTWQKLGPTWWRRMEAEFRRQAEQAEENV